MSYGILDIITKKLADELELKPLGENEVVEFRLKRAGKVNPYSTRKTSSPQGHILPGKEMIQDKHDLKQRMKLIQNIVGYNPIQEPGKSVIMNPVEGYVKFGPSGSIFVTLNNPEVDYLFMKLHNKNESNPNRINTKPVVFYEVNETKELTLKNNVFDYRALAAQALLYASDSQVIEIARKIQRAYPAHYVFDFASDISKIKASVAHVAEKQPIDFIKAVKEPLSYTRLVIDNAVARKLIFFDDHVEKRAWTWKKDVAVKKTRVIVKLDSSNDENPLKSLVDFLQTAEGNEHRLELVQIFEDTQR